MFRTAALAILGMSLALQAAAVHALTCETDSSKFDFMSATLTPFHMGTKEEVDRAYESLRRGLGPLEKTDRPVIFYSKGYTRLTQHECKAEKCTHLDILEGLNSCSAMAMSKEDSCYPLAAVYKENLYCLLYPDRADFDASKGPYIPFQD